MIFENLAKFVMKHARLIIIVWIVVLLLSVYPAIHASEKLSYSTSSMGSSDTESIAGLEIIADHFESQTDSESMQLILIVYNQADSTVLETLDTKIGSITSTNDKVSSVILAGDVAAEDGNSHMRYYAVTYKTGYSSSDIADDTGNLRNQVHSAVSATFDGSTTTYKTYVTGTPAISYDASDAMSKDMARIDPISILLILVLVGLFFRSFVSSAAPPITIGVAFALVLCALFFIGQVLDIYYIVEMLLIVSMLGAGCDYCIFILARYREERRRGQDHESACKDAITWAGESVFTSGLAVMIGFGSMMVCNFRLVSTMGLGLAIGIIFALLAALTLMSSLLVLLGDRLFWPSGADGPKLKTGYVKKMGDVAHKYFEISTHFSIKHAKAIIVATVLFTVPMVYVYATSEDSYDMIGSMMNGDSQEGMNVMTEYAGGGSIMPNYAVIQTTQSLGTVTYIMGNHTDGGLATLTWSTDTMNDGTPYLVKVQSDLTAMQNEVKALDNVDSAYFSSFDSLSPTGTALSVTWSTIASQLPLSADTDIAVALYAIEESGMLPATATAMISKINTEVFTTEVRAGLAAAGLISDPNLIPFSGALATGIMDWMIFVETATVGTTYNAEGTSASINYVNLTMATHEQAMSDNSIKTVSSFKSIVHSDVDKSTVLSTAWISGTAAVMVEIKDVVNEEFLKIEITAIILIILLLFFVMKSYFTPIRAVVTIFMSVIWTVAITHLLFGNVLHDGVLWILPIILLVICLGLGMDYDILLTTRIREYTFSKGMDNDEAIHQAVLHSGSVITICGIIMGCTFGTLMLSSTVMLQQMGFALCFAILVDALIVRTYIVPAAMHLMGRWNWMGPKFLKGNNPVPVAPAAEEEAENDLDIKE